MRRLQVEAPGALVVWPGPEGERPDDERIWIQLAAWAVEIAAGLHERYGELVDLQVGAMRFPAGDLAAGWHGDQLPGGSAVEAGLDVVAPSPLLMRSGWSGSRDVVVTNRGAGEQVLISNGKLASAVTDTSGRVVGRFVGPQSMPRVGFEIGPGQSRTVPVLVGTASLAPELGYAVPLGTWALAVELQLEAGGFLVASLELTITP